MRTFGFNRSSMAALSLAAVLTTVSHQAVAQSVSAATEARNVISRYYPASRVLLLPILNVWSGGLDDGEYLFNVQLRNEGGNLFRLESAGGVDPLQECTESEIVAAIPQLTLSLSLAQAETIIGCYANLSNEEIDLETGKTVMAHWTGSDGIPNSMNESLGKSEEFSGADSVSYTRSRPTIRMIFQEGVIQMVSYLPRFTQSICSPWDFEKHFRTLEVGMSYSTVSSALGCAGKLAEIRVDQEGLRHHYIWQTHGLIVAAATSNTSGTASAATTSSTTQYDVVAGDAVFKDGSLETYTLTGLDGRFAPEGCPDAVLQEAYASILVGQSILDMEGRLDCSVHTIIATEINGRQKTSYSWVTRLRQAQLQTPNRRLKIVTEEGVVVTKEMSRF